MINMLDNQDKEFLNANYQTKDKCNECMKKNAEEITALKVLFAQVTTKLNIMIAIMSAIGVSMLSVAIKAIFG